MKHVQTAWRERYEECKSSQEEGVNGMAGLQPKFSSSYGICIRLSL